MYALWVNYCKRLKIKICKIYQFNYERRKIITWSSRIRFCINISYKTYDTIYKENFYIKVSFTLISPYFLATSYDRYVHFLYTMYKNLTNYNKYKNLTNPTREKLLFFSKIYLSTLKLNLLNRERNAWEKLEMNTSISRRIVVHNCFFSYTYLYDRRVRFSAYNASKCTQLLVRATKDSKRTI